MPFIKYLLPVLYILGIYSAYLAGSLFRRTRSAEDLPAKSHFPWTTFFLLLAVAIPTTLQFFFPSLLPLFQRDTTRIMSGEWWRLITSLFFQDGGISGAIFNLVSLLLIGFLAEQYWDSISMLIIFFVGGFIGQLTGIVWQAIGAGNSVANFSLAASITMLCLLRRSPRPVQVTALLALGAYVVLVLLRDVHGPAALAGAVLALVLSRMQEAERDR